MAELNEDAIREEVSNMIEEGIIEMEGVDENGELMFSLSARQEMFAALNDPERTVADAMNEAVDAVLRSIFDDPGVRYLVEEIVRRTMDRPPMLDEGGEDRQYWATTSLVYMKVLGRVIEQMYNPYEEK